DVVATHAVIGDHLPLKVSDELERQAAELVGERLVREDGVDADAEDPDTMGDRVFVPRPKLGQLGPSTTGEVEHIEEEDRGGELLERLAQGELLAAGGGQLEVGRFVPHLQHVKKSRRCPIPARTSQTWSRR